jgi:type I restriction-modification system DNA methylase subunit
MDNKNLEKIYKMADSLRGSLRMEDIRNLLVGILMIRWHIDRESASKILKSGDFVGELTKAIKDIEESNKELDGALTALVLEKTKGKENLLLEMKDVLEELENFNGLTKESIRDMANYLLLESTEGDDLHVTPESIRKIMVGIIQPLVGNRIADYFTGTGSITLETHNAFGEKGLEYFGKEMNRDAYLLSLLLMEVNGIENCNLENKDVFMLEDAKEKYFDYIFMDAPFSMKNNLEKSEIFKYGMPSKSSADWANYQIALHALKKGGMAIVTAPMGALFRVPDRDIRKAIVEDDKIEAVVQLPASLYAETAISTALIVFNSAKEEAKRNKIVFVDASKEYTRKNRRQNELNTETIEKVIKVIKEGFEIEGFSTLVDLSVIGENEYNLNSSVYINAKVIKDSLGKTIKLKEIAEVLPGVQINSRDMTALKRNPTHYYLNIKNVQDEGIVYNEDERIRDKKFDWYGKYDIKAGDIILTTKGTTTRMLIVPDGFKESFISSNLTIIRVNKTKYDPYVLKKYLESDIGKLVLESITTGSTISLINARRLEGIEVPEYDKSGVLEIGSRIKENETEFWESINEAKRIYDDENRRILKELNL